MKSLQNESNNCKILKNVHMDIAILTVGRNVFKKTLIVEAWFKAENCKVEDMNESFFN